MAKNGTVAAPNRGKKRALATVMPTIAAATAFPVTAAIATIAIAMPASVKGACASRRPRRQRKGRRAPLNSLACGVSSRWQRGLRCGDQITATNYLPSSWAGTAASDEVKQELLFRVLAEQPWPGAGMRIFSTMGTMMIREMEEARTRTEFPCRICGKASVVDVTNACLGVESGSYCPAHAPRIELSYQLEATA